MTTTTSTTEGQMPQTPQTPPPAKPRRKKASSAPKRTRSKAGEPRRKPRRTSLVADERTCNLLKSLARIQCTQREAAGVLGVSEYTICIFLGPDGPEAARAAWESGREEGRMSVRRKQFEAAMSGNITALIWWGKQHLNQSDRIERSDVVDVTTRASVQVLAAPDIARIEDRTSALREFEGFQLRLRAEKAIDVTPLPVEDVKVAA
jgi:hypothetical protein